MKGIMRFVVTHRRMITLKVVIAIGLVVNHYWPNQLGSTIVNLVWLLAF